MQDKIAAEKSKGQLPGQAKVAIIGGGVIGCSAAYHLTKLGWKDIILLERSQLTAGTTWHAAGLVEAGGFFDETTIEMAKYSLELYSSLESETGLSTGYKNVGMLEFATNPSRLEEQRRMAAYAHRFDVPMQEIPPEMIQAG